uniref:CCDC93 coiled-coil domain-containing protein n=2 Tax=Chrysotila carterae TaxID=13221 RepID=A0A7S4B525_CHRCT
MAQVRRLRAERALAEKQLQRERAALQAESERASLLRSEQTSAAESLSLEQQALDEARGRVEALSAEAAALAAQVESASGEIGPTERLLAEHAALKRAQADFKKECAAELKRLQQERRRQTEESTDEADVSDQEAELSRLLEAESARLIALKQQLAQRSREAGALQRRVDERPSRAELMQFERRYRELYRQLASKSEETKKYFSSFNALEEERGYLHKEVSLINSIHDNFAKAGAAPKDKLVESIEGLVQSVQVSLEKVQQRLRDDLRSKDVLQQQYDEMVDKQRKYYKLVREFQEEAQKLDQTFPP